MKKVLTILAILCSYSVIAYQAERTGHCDNLLCEENQTQEQAHISSYPQYIGEYEDYLYHGDGTLYINPNLRFEGKFRYGHPYTGHYIETIWNCIASYGIRKYSHSGYNKELIKRVTHNKCKNDLQVESCEVKCEEHLNVNSFNFETENIIYEQQNT